MKKLTLSLAALVAACTVSAQDLVSKKGEPYLLPLILTGWK